MNSSCNNGRLKPLGCPIRRSTDQRLLSGFPLLIATCYVLHRLLAPRHPPYALSSLITKLTYRVHHSIELSDNCICPNLPMCSYQRTDRNFLMKAFNLSRFFPENY